MASLALRSQRQSDQRESERMAETFSFLHPFFFLFFSRRLLSISDNRFFALAKDFLSIPPSLFFFLFFLLPSESTQVSNKSATLPVSSFLYVVCVQKGGRRHALLYIYL